jgi:hypothetical protein
VGGVAAAISKTAAAPIERVKLLIQNQVCNSEIYRDIRISATTKPSSFII